MGAQAAREFGVLQPLGDFRISPSGILLFLGTSWPLSAQPVSLKLDEGWRLAVRWQISWRGESSSQLSSPMWILVLWSFQQSFPFSARRVFWSKSLDVDVNRSWSSYVLCSAAFPGTYGICVNECILIEYHSQGISYQDLNSSEGRKLFNRGWVGLGEDLELSSTIEFESYSLTVVNRHWCS